MNNLIESIKKLPINIDQDFIIDRLQDRFRWPMYWPTYYCPSVEIIKPYDQIHGIEDSKFDLNEMFPDGFLAHKKATDLFLSGHTLLLSNIGTFHKDIRTLYKILCAFFQKHVQINMYVGSGLKSVSFPPHNHPYDVIVKNVSGTSKWIVDNKKIILEDNNVLFIPRGADHCVTQIRGFKCSLTCNLPNI